MLKHLLFWLAALTLSAEVLVQSNFQSGLQNWSSPDYWNGSVSAADGRLLLQSEERQGKTFGRAYTNVKQLPWGGQILELTLQARGQGELRPGLILYYAGADGKIDYSRIRYLFAETPALLQESFQKVAFTHTLGNDQPVMIAPCLQVDGPGRAEIDDIRLQTVVKPGAVMEAVSRHQVVADGAATLPELSFRFSRPDVPVLLFHQGTTQELRSGADGVLTVSGLPSGTGLQRITAAAEGAAASVYVDVLPAAEWAELAALADRLRLQAPLRLLFIGDSLTDFDRGHNCLDKLEFWVSRSNPGLFSCRNAAVRGDYILRVEERLLNKKAFQQQVYDDLFGSEYDLIGIWLGHNDTRTDSKEGFRQPLVPAAEQEAAYRRVIAHIRQHSQAPILLVAPSPSNEAVFLDRVAKMPADGRVIMFGKGEFVREFDAVLRRLAAELQLEYLDLHGAMSAYPELPALYQADGVHLSETGHRFAARQLLQALATRPQPKK